MPLDLAIREIAQLPVGFRRFARSFIFGDASREPASHGYHWLLPDNDGKNRLGTGNAGTSAYTDAEANIHVQGWVKVEALLQLVSARPSCICLLLSFMRTGHCKRSHRLCRLQGVESHCRRRLVRRNGLCASTGDTRKLSTSMQHVD